MPIDLMIEQPNHKKTGSSKTEKYLGMYFCEIYVIPLWYLVCVPEGFLQ